MQAPSGTELERDVLSIIRIGIPVFDKDNHKVGDVERVQLESQSTDDPITRPLGIVNAPQEVQQQFMQDGFVQIYSGLLFPDRYATPEQIAGITEEGLFLNVSGDALIIL